MNALNILRAGPGVSLQDLGRTGYLAQGLSRGGAADPLALAEGAALLGQPPDLAALEIASSLELEARMPLRIALTGAPMRARCGASALAWNASHDLPAGERLRLGPLQGGVYGYLTVSGGIDVPQQAGGRGAHLAAGLGAPLTGGEVLPLGPASPPHGSTCALPVETRFEGGELRLLAGPQTPLFAPETLDRFLQTPFTRTAWGNRQGVKLGFEGPGFLPAAGLDLLSEPIVPGDVQVTGDGTPFVLGPECQTIGGYPRIGTLLPDDLARLMQASPGASLRFRLTSLEEALLGHTTPAARSLALRRQVRPRRRDPADIPDLLSYGLISGVTAGRELTDEEPQA